jgi:ABC-2 type transport system ATP-binding protein
MSAPYPAVEATGLAKSYRGRPALRGISFSVARGEVFTIVGPNGSGKTTTVEILEGIRRHDGGSFRVLGGSPSDLRVRASIGVQLQDAEMMPNLRPVELVALFRSFYPRGIEPREALARVQFDPPRRALVRELSGGQRKRLAIALAIVNDPEIVFLDEPAAGLDPAARREVWGVIGGLRVQGRAVVLTTHYLEEAERLSDRVAILEAGRIAAMDTPGALVGASRLAGRIVFTLVGALPDLADRVSARFPASEVSGASVRVASAALEDDLHRIFAFARSVGSAVRDLAVHAPTLEDVYFERTGRAWPGDEPPAGGSG